MTKTKLEPEISGVAVVVLGDFNPAVFSPAWFAMQGLLPQAAAEDAEVEAADRDLTSFSTVWLKLRVTPDRFEAATERGPSVRVPDLVLRVFEEKVPHAPVGGLGINRTFHFRLEGPAERDRIGRQLAPLEPWESGREKLGFGGDGDGMASLTMRQSGPRGEGLDGGLHVTIEHSNRVGNGRSGLYVRVVEHRDANKHSPSERRELFKWLAGGFDESVRRADQIAADLMSLRKSR